MARLRESGEGRAAWDEEWVRSGRLEVVTGDLEGEKLGMGDEVWDRLAKEVDAIVHNGAIVSLHDLLLCVIAELISSLVGTLGLPLQQAS
jgi:L-aminoadipate-semialdehyde dehydrogenase